MIQEVDEAEDEELMHTKPQLRLPDEERQMDVRTMVFGMAASGDMRVGYVFLFAFGLNYTSNTPH